MIISRIKGATRVLGQQQGYLGLPVRDELKDVAIGNEIERCHAMTTAWEPTPEEVLRIMAGAPIYLSVLGTQHPPVMLDVGAIPDGVT